MPRQNSAMHQIAPFLVKILLQGEGNPKHPSTLQAITMQEHHAWELESTSDCQNYHAFAW